MPHEEVSHPAPIYSETLFVAEFLALRFSPVYWGLTIPHGDGSAVVIIPGLLGVDLQLFELHAWLRRTGYKPYYSGMGFVADCPNQLSRDLDEAIDRAYRDTGRRVHLVGHSLGGIFARIAAVRRPHRVASVISLGSPFRGLSLHSVIGAVSQALRERVRAERPELPKECGSSRCECAFGQSLGRQWPRSVRQTAVYTRCDGMVDWRYCLSGKPEVDVEVVGTHLGLLFNADVFRHIAYRLAA